MVRKKYNKVNGRERGINKARHYSPVNYRYWAGGASKIPIQVFSQGDYQEWTTTEVIERGLLRLIENPLRKTNLFPLESSEPMEVVKLFNDLQPQLIYFADSEAKVIGAVERLIAQQMVTIPVQYGTIDLTRERLPYKGDIVIAYNVVRRTKKQEQSLEAITSAVNPGGLLSMDGDSHIPGFTQLRPGVYLKECSPELKTPSGISPARLPLQTP